MNLAQRPLAVSALIAAIAAAAIALRAQTPSAPTFRSGVDVVNVDVSVLDKNRRPVRGLTADDFTILEDGKVRPIVVFSAVDLPAASPVGPGAAPWIRSTPSDVSTNDVAPDGRLLVIVFDWTIRQEDLGRARRIATAAVNEMGANDLGGVIFTSGFSNGGVSHNFTSDKARLLAAINQPITPAAVDANGELADKLEMTDVVDTPTCTCGVCAYERVSDVADAVANIPGRRKTVLFIATYFPPPSPPVPAPRPFGSDAPVKIACTPDIPKARDRTIEKLALANLTVHVVDPSGGAPLQANLGTQPGGTLATTGVERQNNLTLLSNLTGGRHVFEDNRAELTLPAIMQESSSYYLLAFAAADLSKAGDGLNRIQVKVRGRDLTVQARSAYRPGNTAGAIAAAARQASLVEAVRASLPRADQRLLFTATPFGPGMPGGTPTVAVVLRVEPTVAAVPSTAPVPVDPSARSYDVIHGVVLAFDPDGKIVASKKHAGEIPWAPGSTTPRAYELLTALELKPGRYEVRAALDSSAGKRSSVYGFVEVPRFDEDPLTLSGIALAARPAAMSGPKGALDAVLPLVPTARREFSVTDEVTAFLRVYHGQDKPASTTLVARLVDSGGQIIREERITEATSEYQMDVPVSSLESGEYLLEFAAESGGQRAMRSVRFRMQ
jgi:VWFA-related protein